MKIVTWNVNSIRARLPRLLEFLKMHQPDVVMLQEIKCQVEQFPTNELQELGYSAAVRGQKSYNGVATLFSRRFGIWREWDPPSTLLQDGARVLLTAGEDKISYLNIYVPNGQTIDSPQFTIKLRWLEELLAWVKEKTKNKNQMIIGGDFNIAPEDIDCHDPGLWENNVLFTLSERELFQKFLDAGFVDVFRKKNPETRAFSWWDYRNLSFVKNKGMRIDHVLVDYKTWDFVQSVEIVRDFRKGLKPSDHVPVVIELI